ncbi:MAG: hypothetical protein ABI609_02515 [Acidobacteriota bacterium]
MTLGARERRLLGMLAVGLVALTIFRLGPLLWRQAAAEDEAIAAGRSSVGKGDLPALRSETLEIASGSFTVGRDPFRFGAPPSPPPPTPPSKAELEAMRLQQEREAAARLAAEQARDLYARTPHPPAVNVKFLGSFGPKNHRIAVFSEGGQIINAAEGEVVAKKFVVDKIGFESVDLKFVGFPNEPPARLAAGGQG